MTPMRSLKKSWRPCPRPPLTAPAGLHLCAQGEGPAVMRFHLVVDVAGECLDETLLRSALVEEISERFTTPRVAVSAAFALSGRAS